MWSGQWRGPGPAGLGPGLKYEIVLGPGLDIIVARRAGPGPHNSICGPDPGWVCTIAAGPGRAWASNHICGPGLGLDFRPVQVPSVHHRVSSVAHPHSNCRAELGVKTVKRMLVGSTGPGGSLNTDAFQRAMLAYRNTPDPVSRVSPAEIIFGRRIRDFIPAPP